MAAGPPPRVLAIAGSDSSGGAGIQADIKTITMLGGHAMTAITAVTAQNTLGVQGITPLAGEFVAEQIVSCTADIGVDAIKIGMLQNADIIGHVADTLGQLAAGEAPAPIVLDPVMVATSGAPLIERAAIEMMEARLFGLASLLTPNLPELELLSGGGELRTLEAMQDAAIALAEKYGCHVLAKGGHTDDERIIDLLVEPKTSRSVAFEHARIDTPHTHGTGCTLSSAIATLIGHGQPLEHAVRLAREFVHRAIAAAPGLGSGNGPLGHYAVRGS